MGQVVFQCCLWLGLTLVVAYLLFGLQRGYLLLMGLGFLGCALSLLLPLQLRWLAVVPALFLYVLALVDAVHDSRARLERLRAEQREREASFAELQLALVEAAKAKEEQGEC